MTDPAVNQITFSSEREAKIHERLLRFGAEPKQQEEITKDVHNFQTMQVEPEKTMALSLD